MPELIDIGINLCDSAFAADRPVVMQAALAAGVSTLIITGTTPAVTEAALPLCHHPEQAPQCYTTAGYHPHYADQWHAHSRADLLHLCRDPAVVAVGETGLDFYRDLSPRDTQIKVFAEQIEIAIETGLPLFLHERDAFADQSRLLLRYRHELPTGVAHCFTGADEALDCWLELGLMIGITGWVCDERRGQQLQAQVARIPDDRLLLESDAPYLLPRTLRPRPKSRRNVPAHLTEVLTTVARLRGQTADTVAAVSSANARRLFRLPAQ